MNIRPRSSSFGRNCRRRGLRRPDWIIACVVARLETIWKQVIVVYRGSILADGCILLLKAAPPSVCSSPVWEKVPPQMTYPSPSKNFGLSLITSRETDVILHFGGDPVPDYLITQLSKVLQQGYSLRIDHPRQVTHHGQTLSPSRRVAR